MQNGFSQAPRQGHQIWIVGPGAVGGLFCANLLQKNQFKTTVFGSGTGVQKLTVEHSGGNYSFEVPLAGEEPPSAHEASEIDCYLTVHTPVLSAAIHTVQEFLTHARVAHLRYIVCSNGIVRDEHLAHMLQTSDTQVSCYRALLYFGAKREQSGGGQRIQHLGGSRIVYGVLRGKDEEAFNPQQDLDWFDWERSSAIRTTEREKFFMNTLLALYIGPRLLKNASVFQYLPKDDYQLLLKSYIAVTQPFARSSTELDADFKKLIADTQHNVNSFSLKWHAGETGVIEQLIDDLRYLLNQSQNQEAVITLQQKLNAQLQHLGWDKTAGASFL